MALKNLFDMAKADKYTADGREAIIKAQEAETEDKVYQIGEISQKTGLQKTANGWVKPKSGKQPGAKKQEEPKNVHGVEVDKIYERQLKRIKELKAKGFSDEQIDNDKIIKQTKEDMKNVGKKPENKKGAAENKTTIRQGPKTKTLNESPAEHVQKNLDAYKGYQPYDMEELVLKPSGYEKQTSARVPGGGQSITYTKNGAEDITLFFDKNGELENADVAGSKPAEESKPERFNYRASLEKNPRDAFSFKGTVTHSIPTNQYHYDELQNLASFMREEKATYQNALKSRAQALVDGHRSNGDWEPKKEQALMDIAKAVGFDKELHKFIEEENRGYDLGYSEDSAPSLSEIVDRVYNIGEISEKTGLQKTANGWVKPSRNKEIQNAGKHAESVKAAQKAKKEEARKQQRAEGEANARAFQEKVEKGEIKPDGAEVHQQQGEEIKGNLEAAKYYFDKAQSFSPTDPSYKTYMTKAKQYNDEAKAQADDNGFDFEEMHNSGVTQAVNKYAEEQSKPAAESKPAESKPAAAPKLNQVEKVDGANRPYRIKGTQFYFETPEEAETAIVAGTRGEGKTYAKPSSDPTINEIQNALGFKLDSEYAGKYSMDDFIKKTGKDEYGVRVWSFGTDSKGTLIDTIVEGYNKPDATIKKENGEWRLHYTNRDGKKMIVTPKGREWPTSDSAPRQLTGDCRIRIRKEKPALTGDTKIRVRK